MRRSANRPSVIAAIALAGIAGPSAFSFSTSALPG